MNFGRKVGIFLNPRCIEDECVSDWRVIVETKIIPDDGSDGIFWRNGKRYLREKGKEIPLIELAPHLEDQAMKQTAIDPFFTDLIKTLTTYRSME